MNFTEVCKNTIESLKSTESSISDISSNAKSMVEEFVGGFLFTGVPTFDQSSFNAILKEKGIA
jgi:hypothetical protein